MMYLGMNASSGEAITDLDHIRQSVTDILSTPVGSRVMRREYGSLVSTLTDAPMNDTIHLQMMSAVYGAIMRWEPRVTIRVMQLQAGEKQGSLIAELTCTRSDNDATFTLSAQVADGVIS